jgi:hypothetical protein
MVFITCISRHKYLFYIDLFNILLSRELINDCYNFSTSDIYNLKQSKIIHKMYYYSIWLLYNNNICGYHTQIQQYINNK